jgi:hypothetical protein
MFKIKELKELFQMVEKKKKVIKKPIKKEVKPIVKKSEPKPKHVPVEEVVNGWPAEKEVKAEPKKGTAICDPKAKLGEHVLFCKNPNHELQLALVTGFNNDTNNPNLHVYTKHGLEFRPNIAYSKEPKQRTWKVFK